jgi:hypothetical protein
MKIKQITEALKPSQYRPLVKGWDKARYADIFTNPKYKHDKKGYRVFIPIGATTANEASPVQTAIEKSLQKSGFSISDYTKGIAQQKDTNRNIKIGKLLTKLKQPDLLNKFNTDKTREGTKKEYMVVISRHPYDIGGQSTDRGWRSCMNLVDGDYNEYVPIDVAVGTVVAYVTDKNDPDLKNPTGRMSIKPFVDVLGSSQVEFGIENRVYGTKVPGFVEAVSAWVDEINDQNILDNVAAFEIDPRLYNDSPSTRTTVKGGSQEEREAIQAIIDNPKSIGDYKNPSLLLQMAAIKNSVYSIQHIKNPAPEVQMAAVTQNRVALRYIKNPSTELQMAAVTKSGYSIEYIKNPSPEVQLAAVKKYGGSIQYIKDPSPEVQLAAVTQDGDAVGYIKNPSPEVQLAAVTNDGMAIGYIKNPSPEVIAYMKQRS